MHPILRNILAVVAAWIAGSIVNMGLVQLGHIVFPLEGLDPNDMEAMVKAAPTLDDKHFIFPVIAHALGTFVGAMVAVLLAAGHHMKFAWLIGGLFFMGGIMVNFMIPGPIWVAIIDISLAYFPMTWLGGTLGMKLSPSPTAKP